MTSAVTRPLEWAPAKQAISRVPYLPGLDGMRAIAVVAVMVYHANNSWLPGGFLGVEVFFVISGYLITLLLIGEHERTGRVSLGEFWLRRARRLLPALFVMMTGLVVYTAFWREDALGQLRGDVVAGVGYVSNWYQIWVGQGYTASGDFAPLRHLWSLAVEEQFYLVWPLVMVGLMRLGRRRLPDLSRWLFAAAVVVAVAVALLYHPGTIGEPDVTPSAYWTIGDRPISKLDALYLGTISRAGGLLLGAAFAMIWRPVAIMRGPMRTKGRTLDGVAAAGLAGLAAMTWFVHVVRDDGSADPLLFRGGFLLCGLATVGMMAAVTHQGALAGPILGNPVLLWIGTRSYGLYLYHWPIYQIIREVAGKPLTLSQFVLAMAITAPITEVSYRFIETPIRKRQLGRWWARLREQRDPMPRRLLGAAGVGVLGVALFSAGSMATAELRQNDIAESLDKGEEAVTDIDEILNPSSSAEATTPTTPTTPAPTASGQTTVVTTPTTTAAPTTTAPPAPIAKLAIGDSVMKGAAPDLAALGFTVLAEESRQFAQEVAVVQQLQAQSRLGDVVIVHLGTNGPIRDDDLQAMFTALADVPTVVVLTVQAPGKAWIEPNNDKLNALPATFPNVKLLYWDGLVDDCPGDCIYNDDIHLKSAGAAYYAELIDYRVDN